MPRGSGCKRTVSLKPALKNYQDPISKNKSVGDVAKLVELLPSMYKVLRSYFSLSHFYNGILSHHLHFHTFHIEYGNFSEITFQEKEQGQGSNYNKLSVCWQQPTHLLSQYNTATLHLIEILAKSDRCSALIVNLKYILMSFKWLELLSAELLCRDRGQSLQGNGFCI